jgi:Mrp family chromosome partitioning ATPase
MESNPSRSRSEEHAFKRYYRTVRDHALLIVACIVITLAAAVLYVAIAPRKYSAQAQMLVSPVPPTDSTLIGLPVLHSSGDPVTDVLTAANLITNQQVAAAAASALHLRQSPAGLLGSVQATPIGQSNLVAVQATASSARRAQAIADQFAKQVIATRAAALHAAVAAILPGLRAQQAGLPPGQRNGTGTLGDQISQLQQLKSSNDPTITIASLASLPTGPDSPRTKLTLIAALFGGLILGIGAAFGFDALDPRMQREEQLREVFDLPVLARIPLERRARKGLPILPRELSFGSEEGYRTLRTTLSSRAAGEGRAILVTGSSPAEGKSTSAINLAVALAQGGARVILIEADLGNTSVRVLAVEHPGPDLADRLSFAAAQQLIKHARALSEYVVIDSPPLTAVSDALPLAQLVDEVLVVARIGSTRMSKLRELRDILLEERSYPTGIVLIGAPSPRGGYYYYSLDHTASRRPRGRAAQPSRGEAETIHPLPK